MLPLFKNTALSKVFSYTTKTSKKYISYLVVLILHLRKCVLLVILHGILKNLSDFFQETFTNSCSKYVTPTFPVLSSYASLPYNKQSFLPTLQRIMETNEYI